MSTLQTVILAVRQRKGDRNLSDAKVNKKTFHLDYVLDLGSYGALFLLYYIYLFITTLGLVQMQKAEWKLYIYTYISCGLHGFINQFVTIKICVVYFRSFGSLELGCFASFDWVDNVMVFMPPRRKKKYFHKHMKTEKWPKFTISPFLT